MVARNMLSALAVAGMATADFYDANGELVVVDQFGCSDYIEYELKAPDTSDAEYAPWVTADLIEHNQPATCFRLVCHDENPNCMDRVMLIEAEAKMDGFSVCVQNEGAESNNNDNINRMCGEQVSSCRNPQYRNADNDVQTEMNIKIFCDSSCPSSSEEVVMRVRQSVETFSAGETDVLDEWCANSADPTAWPSYQKIADIEDSPLYWLAFSDASSTAPTVSVLSGLGMLAMAMLR